MCPAGPSKILYAWNDEKPTGEDSFWVVDTAIGYRLPKRFGRLAFQVKNLFDREFSFQDTDPGNPTVKPRRLALLTLSLGV